MKLFWNYHLSKTGVRVELACLGTEINEFLCFLTKFRIIVTRHLNIKSLNKSKAIFFWVRVPSSKHGCTNETNLVFDVGHCIRSEWHPTFGSFIRSDGLGIWWPWIRSFVPSGLDWTPDWTWACYLLTSCTSGWSWLVPGKRKKKESCLIIIWMYQLK